MQCLFVCCCCFSSQSVANEIEEQKTSVETVITSSKPMNNPSNTSRIQENISDESHANQKPKYEPIIVRRTPSAAAAATHTVERVSKKNQSLNEYISSTFFF